jgi:hypothetical protein
MIIHLAFIVFVYSIIFLVVSPIIDHAFTPLHPDEPHYEVLGEFIAQIITVSLSWYGINACVHYVFSKYKMPIRPHEEMAIEVITAIILVGLQKNLLEKLHYLTKVHPIRNTIVQLFKD